MRSRVGHPASTPGDATWGADRDGPMQHDRLSAGPSPRKRRKQVGGSRFGGSRFGGWGDSRRLGGDGSPCIRPRCAPKGTRGRERRLGGDKQLGLAWLSVPGLSAGCPRTEAHSRRPVARGPPVSRRRPASGRESPASSPVCRAPARRGRVRPDGGPAAGRIRTRDRRIDPPRSPRSVPRHRGTSDR